MEKQILFEPFKQQIDFLECVVSGKYRTVIYGGSIRAGKTFAGLGALIILSKIYPGSRWVIVRKDLQTIKRNTLPSWDKIKPTNFISRFNQDTMTVTFNNGSQLIFFGENYDQDKELDRWKGLECNGFLLEEVNEMQFKGYNKAIERSGSYVIPKTDKQPKPLIICTLNPSNNWVKELFYDKFKNGTLEPHTKFILANIHDNNYITEEYKESLKSLPKYEYEVFVNGNWDIQLKTGGEFYKYFDLDKHTRKVHYNSSLPVHVTFDNNVYPYIAISLWQISNEGKKLSMFKEIPARDPDNSATAAARLVVNYLKSLNYEDTLFVYGDQTSANRNTISEEKKSFIDLFCDRLRESFSISKKIPSSNPPVSISGDFINAIYYENYLGLEIEIDEDCKEAIADFVNTKADENGNVLKSRIKDPVTKITYEEYGHFSDSKRYLVVKVLSDYFRKFKRRFSADVTHYSTGSGVTNRGF